MGMIPTRYFGPIHATGLMLREEGIRGLYRGYFAYLIATSIYIAIVPLAAELSIQKTALCGFVNDDTDELYQEVVLHKK
jgi:hypothetical protein